MNSILTLIQRIQGVDEYGDPTITETRRQIFCRRASIGQSEFYQAHATGLKPEMKLVIADYLDYAGEDLVEYDGQLYRVLRTYRTGLELELTVYREVNPA
jgi:SPP1 family predicted phage head-tail adaptor